MDNLINFLDNGLYVIGIFVDLSKVFDTVGYGILLQKLSSYGVRGEALIWFQSYLSQISVRDIQWGVFWKEISKMLGASRLNIGTLIIPNLHEWIIRCL